MEFLICTEQRTAFIQFLGKFTFRAREAKCGCHCTCWWSQTLLSWLNITETSLCWLGNLCKDIWAVTWQNQQSECAPSEDSDQPGHPPSLIRTFAVRMKKAWVLSYPLSAQRRLWSDWVDAQADLSLRWAHTHFVGFVTRQLILYNCFKDLAFICWKNKHQLS